MLEMVLLLEVLLMAFILSELMVTMLSPFTKPLNSPENISSEKRDLFSLNS